MMKQSQKYYILENGEIKEVDLKVMAKFFENNEVRQIALDQFNDITISTVFLCTDHRFFGEGPPVLFETLVFGGENDQFQDRYCTLKEAKQGHDLIVNAIKKGEILEHD